jgi:hypothetical protein
MSLTEALSGVAGYHPDLGRQQPAQLHLSTARQQLAAVLPPVGYRIRSSGSGRTLPKVPWIAVLDPDVTTTARRGRQSVDVVAHTVCRLVMHSVLGIARTAFARNCQCWAGASALGLLSLT